MSEKAEEILMQISPVNYNSPQSFCGCSKDKEGSPKIKYADSSCYSGGKLIYPSIGDEIERAARNKKWDLPFDTYHDRQFFNAFPSGLKKYKMKQIPKDCMEAARATVEAAKAIKKRFDFEFGKDKYVYVSIGTSPAGVARALELMGNEVKYVPISDLRYVDYYTYEFWQDENNVKDYLKFLDSIGLNNETIENSDKKFVFCDYTCRGTTLKAVQTYLEEIRGFDGSKLAFKSLNNELERYARFHPSKKDEFQKYIKNYLEIPRIQDYCGIPHVSGEHPEEIKTSLSGKSSRKAHDFNYAMACMLEEEGLLKERTKQ